MMYQKLASKRIKRWHEGLADTTRYHDHCALGDMLCDAFTDTVEAGNPGAIVLCTSSTPVSDWRLPLNRPGIVGGHLV